MAITLPSDYDAAAEVIYKQGRAQAAAGRPRLGEVGPSVPGQYLNVAGADASNPDAYARYGSVVGHYYRGYDDQQARWADYGYKQSMGSGYYTTPNPASGPMDSTRRQWLRWLYVFGYNAATTGAAIGSGESYARPALGIGPQTAMWEVNSGREAGRVGNVNPEVGYVEPPPGLDAPVPVSGIERPAAQSGIGDGGFLQLLVVSKLLAAGKRRRNEKQDEEEQERPRRRTRKKRRFTE